MVVSLLHFVTIPKHLYKGAFKSQHILLKLLLEMKENSFIYLRISVFSKVSQKSCYVFLLCYCHFFPSLNCLQCVIYLYDASLCWSSYQAFMMCRVRSSLLICGSFIHASIFCCFSVEDMCLLIYMFILKKL